MLFDKKSKIGKELAMKKFIILFTVILLVGIDYVSFADDCPQGYTPKTVYFTWDEYPGCNYALDYCCKWDNQNLELKIIILWIWHPSGCVPSPGEWADFRDHFILMTRIHAIDNCAPPMADCDEEVPVTVEIRYSPCYYYENIWWAKFTGSEEWLLVLKRCIPVSDMCIRTYRICKDYELGEIVVLSYNCYPVEQPDCSFDEPTLPPRGKSWEEAWTTDCFARYCCPE